MQEYVGSEQPVLMDWAVGLAFPCQQPMLHANGVTEVPKFRITPDYNAKRKDTDTWQDGLNGGLLGITDLLLRAHVMATYLSRGLGPRLGLAAQVRHRSSTPDPPHWTSATPPAAGCTPRVHQIQDLQPRYSPRFTRASIPHSRWAVDRIRLGDATLTRVVECQVDDLPAAVFPQTPPQAWRELADEFSPTFWDDDDHWRIALQTWVLEVDGLTVIVDTGAGNDKARPRMAALDQLRTNFLV